MSRYQRWNPISPLCCCAWTSLKMKVDSMWMLKIWSFSWYPPHLSRPCAARTASAYKQAVQRFSRSFAYFWWRISEAKCGAHFFKKSEKKRCEGGKSRLWGPGIKWHGIGDRLSAIFHSTANEAPRGSISSVKGIKHRIGWISSIPLASVIYCATFATTRLGTIGEKEEAWYEQRWCWHFFSDLRPNG